MCSLIEKWYWLGFLEQSHDYCTERIEKQTKRYAKRMDRLLNQKWEQRQIIVFALNMVLSSIIWAVRLLAISWMGAREVHQKINRTCLNEFIISAWRSLYFDPPLSWNAAHEPVIFIAIFIQSLFISVFFFLNPLIRFSSAFITYFAIRNIL